MQMLTWILFWSAWTINHLTLVLVCTDHWSESVFWSARLCLFLVCSDYEVNTVYFTGLHRALVDFYQSYINLLGPLVVTYLLN